MEKWADYGIEEKRMDSTNSHIEKVKVRPDNGDTLGQISIWKREKIVSKLEDGTTFVTILKNDKGNYNKGENVEIVSVKGKKYIRTDKNDTEKDNLGELPDF